MPNTNIYESVAAKTNGVLAQMKLFVEFVAKNREIRISGNALNNIWNAQSLTQTPISDLYDLIMISPFKDDIVLINIPSQTAFPEIFQYRHIVFDMLQLKPVAKGLYDVIHGLPEFSDKIIINVTDMINKKTLAMQNATLFKGYVVRAVLSRLYFLYGQERTWVPPQVSLYATQVFGTVFSSLLAEQMNLDAAEQSVANTILSYYYLGLNTPDSKAITIQLQNRTDLGDGLFIKRVVDSITETYGHEPITFSQACEVLNQSGVYKLSGSVQSYMFTLASRLYQDKLFAVAAIDYPPVWLWLILETFSTQKTGLAFIIKKRNSRLLKGKDTFLKAINSIDPAKAVARG